MNKIFDDYKENSVFVGQPSQKWRFAIFALWLKVCIYINFFIFSAQDKCELGLLNPFFGQNLIESFSIIIIIFLKSKFSLV